MTKSKKIEELALLYLLYYSEISKLDLPVALKIADIELSLTFKLIILKVLIVDFKFTFLKLHFKFITLVTLYIF